MTDSQGPYPKRNSKIKSKRKGHPRELCSTRVDASASANARTASSNMSSQRPTFRLCVLDSWSHLIYGNNWSFAGIYPLNLSVWNPQWKQQGWYCTETPFDYYFPLAARSPQNLALNTYHIEEPSFTFKVHLRLKIDWCVPFTALYIQGADEEKGESKSHSGNYHPLS